MKNLWKDWKHVADRIARAERIALVLDFDGTLSPIVAKPDAARLPPEERSLLSRVNGHARCHTMVLSGRRLQDVRSRTGIRSFYYGGNHGLQLAGPGFSFVHPQAQRFRPRLHQIADGARSVLAGLPGVRVENKGLSVSVHYRQVPDGRMRAFRRRLGRFRKSTENSLFRWRSGRKVWELLPRVGWDKGQAVRLFLEHLRAPFALAIGDDVTDEDMFKALKGKGVSVRAGRRAGSAADYFIRGQAEMNKLLRGILDILEKSTGGRGHAARG